MKRHVGAGEATLGTWFSFRSRSSGSCSWCCGRFDRPWSPVTARGVRGGSRFGGTARTAIPRAAAWSLEAAQGRSQPASRPAGSSFTGLRRSHSERVVREQQPRVVVPHAVHAGRCWQRDHQLRRVRLQKRLSVLRRDRGIEPDALSLGRKDHRHPVMHRGDQLVRPCRDDRAALQDLPGLIIRARARNLRP
jgi:hypothetical protein